MYLVSDSSNKVMYSMRIDPALKRLLERVKTEEGVPESEQIRRALKAWFEAKGLLKPERKSR